MPPLTSSPPARAPASRPEDPLAYFDADPAPARADTPFSALDQMFGYYDAEV